MSEQREDRPGTSINRTPGTASEVENAKINFGALFLPFFYARRHRLKLNQVVVWLFGTPICFLLAMIVVDAVLAECQHEPTLSTGYYETANTASVALLILTLFTYSIAFDFAKKARSSAWANRSTDDRAEFERRQRVWNRLGFTSVCMIVALPFFMSSRLGVYQARQSGLQLQESNQRAADAAAALQVEQQPSQPDTAPVSAPAAQTAPVPSSVAVAPTPVQIPPGWDTNEYYANRDWYKAQVLAITRHRFANDRDTGQWVLDRLTFYDKNMPQLCIFKVALLSARGENESSAIEGIAMAVDGTMSHGDPKVGMEMGDEITEALTSLSQGRIVRLHPDMHM